MRPATFYLRTGPFVARVTSSDRRVIEGVPLLYAGNGLAPAAEFCDFHVEIAPPPLRRWIRPKVVFRSEGVAPFLPTAPEQALPALEWGLNWAVAVTVNQYLVIHAASLERNGRAIIIPGPPGAGKSTLCAGLAFRGLRLLSDELTLLRPDGRLIALARPLSLKNESIEVIRRFAPQAVLSPPVAGTAKGTVALVRAPDESVARAAETALPGWVVFPRFRPGAATRLERRSKAASLLDLAESSINYGVLHRRGFELVAALVDRSTCFEFEYGDLASAASLFAAMADEDRIG